MSHIVPATSSEIAREDLILDAANRLLARYGYKKMTIDDLAKEAGIGKGTVYLHFRSKADVVLSHIDRIVQRLLAELGAIAQRETPAPEKLREMLLLRVLFRFDAVQHYTESISEVLRDVRTGLLERRERYFEEEAKVFAKTIREGQRAGLFQPGEALPTARAMIAATNSLLPYSLSTRELGKRSEVQQSAARIVDLLLQGMHQREPE